MCLSFSLCIAISIMIEVRPMWRARKHKPTPIIVKVKGIWGLSTETKNDRASPMLEHCNLLAFPSSQVGPTKAPVALLYLLAILNEGLDLRQSCIGPGIIIGGEAKEFPNLTSRRSRGCHKHRLCLRAAAVGHEVLRHRTAEVHGVHLPSPDGLQDRGATPHTQHD